MLGKEAVGFHIGGTVHRKQKAKWLNVHAGFFSSREENDGLLVSRKAGWMLSDDLGIFCYSTESAFTRMPQRLSIAQALVLSFVSQRIEPSS